MGVYDTMIAVQDLLTIDGFPRVRVGLPKGAISGPYPAWYLDLDGFGYRYDALQAAYPTNTSSFLWLWMIVNLQSKPADYSEFAEWFYKVLPATVRSQLEQAAISRYFEADGDAGARVALSDVRFQYDPTEIVGAIRFTLEISQYA